MFINHSKYLFINNNPAVVMYGLAEKKNATKRARQVPIQGLLCGRRLILLTKINGYGVCPRFVHNGGGHALFFAVACLKVW